MALTKGKKHQIVDDISEQFGSAKLTVIANYQGTPVKAMQTLRREARESGTAVRVVKNRLVKVALQKVDALKDVDTHALTGMLLYASNPADEAAPAQALAAFAKTQPTIAFVGAITPEGSFMSAADVTALAKLPGKDQLRGMLVGTLAAPLGGFVSVLAGNVRGVLNVLNARAETIK